MNQINHVSHGFLFSQPEPLSSAPISAAKKPSPESPQNKLFSEICVWHRQGVKHVQSPAYLAFQLRPSILCPSLGEFGTRLKVEQHQYQYEFRLLPP